MSNRKLYFEWSVSGDEVQDGVPVGFEVQISNNPTFYPICYTIRTSGEIDGPLSGKFQYSTNNGTSWTNYPTTESGVVFNSDYKVRVKIEVFESGFIFASKNGKIYRITPDGKTVVEEYTKPFGQINGISYFDKDNDIWMRSADRVIYKTNTKPIFSQRANSVNAEFDPIGMIVDQNRGTFWQIGRDKVCLKNKNGRSFFCIKLPKFENEYIDEDFSSSSESSGSSDSSQSSSSSKDDGVGYDAIEIDFEVG